MAIFNWKISSMKKGRAAIHSDYIARRGKFSNLNDLVHTEYGNLPGWCQNDPRAFFQAADQHERQNGCACRELVISLPRELTLHEWLELVRALVNRDIGSKPYQYAIHVSKNDEENAWHPHAHIIYSDRIPDEYERPPHTFFARFNSAAPGRGGCRKDSGGRSPLQVRLAIVGRKNTWAALQNQALSSRGHSVRVIP